jgi:hypothetical protein
MVRHNLTTEDSLKRGQIPKLAREKGVVCPRDLEAVGIAGSDMAVSDCDGA